MVKKFDKDTIIGMAESDCKSGVKNFADKIHSLRKSSKITLADLSNMSGVPSSTISDVEKAKYVPSLDIILKLGYALELQRDEIFDLLKGNNLKLNMLENADFMIKMGFVSKGATEDEIKDIMEYANFKIKNKETISYYL